MGLVATQTENLSIATDGTGGGSNRTRVFAYPTKL